MKIVCVMGYPNSGKTTYSKNYSTIIHLDDYPYIDTIIANNIINTITTDEDVCIEGDKLNHISFRQIFLPILFNKFKYANKICVFLDTPKNICVYRENRGRHINQMLMYNIDQPSFDEGWDDIIRIQYSDNCSH